MEHTALPTVYLRTENRVRFNTPRPNLAPQQGATWTNLLGGDGRAWAPPFLERAVAANLVRGEDGLLDQLWGQPWLTEGRNDIPVMVGVAGELAGWSACDTPVRPCALARVGSLQRLCCWSRQHLLCRPEWREA
jgi:hypothetical protein